jgi:hypothetical protein
MKICGEVVVLFRHSWSHQFIDVSDQFHAPAILPSALYSLGTVLIGLKSQFRHRNHPLLLEIELRPSSSQPVAKLTEILRFLSELRSKDNFPKVCVHALHKFGILFLRSAPGEIRIGYLKNKLL